MTLLLTCAILCLEPLVVNQIVDGIKTVENSKSKPYGIESIRIRGKTKKEREDFCRKICVNSVINNGSRYKDAGKPGEFLIFMNKRYCPNDMNWSKNLKSILRKRGFDFRGLK